MMIKKELELYVHIPFCVRKCAYCDFLSAPADMQERTLYVDALTKEIRAEKEEYRNYKVSTIFLGGGTPSVLAKMRLQRYSAPYMKALTYPTVRRLLWK